jgi:hypothetical protein
VALRDELAEGVGEGERVLGVDVDGERGKVDDTGGRFGVDFVEGDVEDGATGFAQVVVWDVGGDPDNFVDRLIATALEGAADGVLTGEEGLGEVSLTMAASGEVSSGRKSRPETRLIFIVESQPGETLRNQPGVGLGGSPLMEMSLFMRMRPRRGQREMETESTPGAARSVSAV